MCLCVSVCVCEECNRLFCRLIRDPIKKQVWEACSALIGPRQARESALLIYKSAKNTKYFQF